MDFTSRELWTVLHGMGFGAIYLLAFAGGLEGLWNLQEPQQTPEHLLRRVRRIKIGMVVMAIASWATVLSGTFLVYPWYRDKAPTSPRSLLLADPNLADWHKFGMEWKEHIAWICPIVATVVAFIAVKYGPELTKKPILIKTLMVLFTFGFASAAVAGAFGAFITKVAPIH